ncbi:MAG: PKD domain-containing protein [Bacteroidia bacterium]
MQKLKLFLFLSFAIAGKSFAQCPVAGFSLPNDTLCDFTFTNTSSAGSYHWDFCSGDLKATPTGTNLGNIGGLSNPCFVKVVKDQGNYYAFIANLSFGNILRYDFGTSLDNPSPDTMSYPGFSLPFGIDVVKDNNNWYALVAQYAPPALIKMDLGPAISNNTTINTNLTIPGLNTPRSVKIVKANNNYYAFVTNESGNGINKIEFGNSLANAVINSSALTDPAFANAWGFDMAYSCDSDNYIGFVANNAGSNITEIDYGNTLTNTGSILQSLTTPSSNPSAINVVRDGNDWNILAVSSSLGELNKLVLGNNLLNPTPVSGNLGVIASISAPRGLSMINDSSRWYGIVTNQGSSTVSMIKFEDSCSASVLISTDTIPQNIYYGASGWQYISITVTDSNGVVSVFTDSVYTVPRPTVDFTYSAACLGQPISFTDLSTIGQGTIVLWHWDFGDGSSGSPIQNPTYLYTSTNDSTYLVTLTATSDAGCAGSFSDSISVHDLPTADFSFLNNQCSETPVQFNDLSSTSAGDSVVIWVWDFGDATALDSLQNPVHSFDSSGTYSIQLIVFGSSGCTDTITHDIIIKPRPIINFTASPTCIGDLTIFTNGTTISDGSTLSYTWTFGDGSPNSNLTNPTHGYPLVAMTYSVTLIANSTNLCADTTMQNVRISTKANPGFIMVPAAACLNNSVQFIDTSTIATGDSIASSIWDFDDGSGVAYGDTVNHIFSSSGSYDVMLTVKSLTSCDTTITKTITVLESPTVNFTFTNVCQGTPMYFYDASTLPPGSTVDSIIWDFGDGFTDYGDSVIHGYSVADTFIVTETVINNFGCSGTITHQVIAYAIPVASFTNNSPACAGNTVNFINTSTVQNDFITGFNWDFGNGDMSVLPNPAYIYNNALTYSVSLIVTSSHGCQATITNSVIVNPSPTFTFTDSLFCLGDTTHFTYIPILNMGSGWTWDFGDGGGAIIPNPKHPYAAPGIYTVTLTVLIPNGCSNSVSQSVTINPKPDAEISSDSVICSGTIVAFDDNSTITSGTINQWSWNFGDGSPFALTQNTNHLYATDSTYLVTLTVASDAGCTGSTSKIIDIAPPPVADFMSNPAFGSPPLMVSFLNTSTGATTYQWTFGDGGSGNGTSPMHTYSDTGVYAVTLVAINSYNCRDTAYGNINVLIPYLDLGITKVFSKNINNLLSLSAELVNFGSTPISKFQISAKTENGSLINEQWFSNTALQPGKTLPYSFTARYEIDPANAPAFYCIEISEINDMTDAVELNNKKCSAISDLFELFDVFPNPTNDQITIAMNVPLDGTVDITIFNAGGQLMKSNAKIPVAAGYNEFSYSIGHFAKGTYACTVKYRDDILTGKVLKK